MSEHPAGWDARYPREAGATNSAQVAVLLEVVRERQDHRPGVGALEYEEPQRSGTPSKSGIQA